MRTIVPGPCPSCNNEIEYLYQTENIPYFSELLIISATCASCGFRYVDTQLLKDAEPVRYELPVNTEEDLAIRVVRSMNGTIEIPELGVRIDPGPACQGFVTNVEGVLNRIEHIVKGAVFWADEEQREHARGILERISSVKAAAFPITLILEDPTGNSALLSDKVKKLCGAANPE